jgi:hypothetical protein
MGLLRSKLDNGGARQPYQMREGRMAKSIEQRTGRIPSDTFLWAAGGSIIGSLILQTMKKRDLSVFVGQWAPTLLILGLYNKIVKTMGHD